MGLRLWNEKQEGEEMTNDRYHPAFYRRLGPCSQHLSPRHRFLGPWLGSCRQHLAPYRRHFQPFSRHFATRPRRLVLFPRHCGRSLVAPQTPFSPLLATVCPISVGYPRSLCFPSTSSNTFLDRTWS